MAELTIPEIKLPEIRVDGDRIQKGFGDARKSLDSAAESLGDTIARLDLPKPIASVVDDVLPRRRRANPIVPIVAIAAAVSALAAGWWFLTSTTTGARVRRSVADARDRMMSGSQADRARDQLDRLVQGGDDAFPATENDLLTRPYESVADPEMGVPVGPGQAAGVGRALD
jgi:hypothetical protein